MESNATSMVSIGEKLRSAREKKSLAIEQVQKQTHIHSSVITALEDGRCDELLTPIYVKGFLKKYSHFLGLDSHEMLKEYSKIHGNDVRGASPASYAAGDGSVDIVSKSVHGVIMLVILIAVSFMLVFLWHKAGSMLKNTKRPPAVAVKPAQAAKTAKRKASVEQPKPTPPKRSPFTLVLRTKKAVRVKLTKDGVALFERVLPKGLSESFTADEKIELDIAKGESVEFILNGKFLGSPGKGVIKGLEVTKAGIRK